MFAVVAIVFIVVVVDCRCYTIAVVACVLAGVFFDVDGTGVVVATQCSVPVLTLHVVSFLIFCDGVLALLFLLLLLFVAGLAIIGLLLLLCCC